jgi:hypothetical protein
MPRQVGDQNPSVAIHKLQNGPSSFLVKHALLETPTAPGGGGIFPSFSFYNVSFRLSTTRRKPPLAPAAIRELPVERRALELLPLRQRPAE